MKRRDRTDRVVEFATRVSGRVLQLAADNAQRTDEYLRAHPQALNEICLSPQARKKLEDRLQLQSRCSLESEAGCCNTDKDQTSLQPSTCVPLASRRLSPSEGNREIHNRKMITSVTEQKPMRKKKTERTKEIPHPLCVDEEEFTGVIRKMVNTAPVERKQVERGYQRKKNPHTGPLFPPTKKG